jgi:hypothetical protein
MMATVDKFEEYLEQSTALAKEYAKDNPDGAALVMIQVVLVAILTEVREMSKKLEEIYMEL